MMYCRIVKGLQQHIICFVWGRGETAHSSVAVKNLLPILEQICITLCAVEDLSFYY